MFIEKTKVLLGTALDPISIDMIDIFSLFPNNICIRIRENNNFKSYLIARIEKSHLPDLIRLSNEIASRLGVFTPNQMGYGKQFPSD